jgi:hypothetical protein
LSTCAGRLLVALATVLGLATAAAQAPPRFGPIYQPPPTGVQPPQPGAPLFGQSWPHVGPDPAPRVGGPNRCPPGYGEPANRIRVAHLVVCVAQQASAGQPLSSLPPSLEHISVNQCIGRPAGSYACGRGGTECCGPNQNNMCFAGAYACSASGTGTGTKSACCINK